MASSGQKVDIRNRKDDGISIIKVEVQHRAISKYDKVLKNRIQSTAEGLQFKKLEIVITKNISIFGRNIVEIMDVLN